MKLYLLSCHEIQWHARRILPLLPERRRLAYACSHSPLTLGAGLLLASLLGVHRDTDLVFGPWRKPFLSKGTPQFSLSHSADRVLLGVSDRLIGVDMEPKDRRISEAMGRRICLPQERQLGPLPVFTRKECAMKLTGLGFSLPLSEIDVTKEFRWENEVYRFFTTEQDGFVISVLSAEVGLPEIQRLSVEELL